ncbi:hypothetical protein [Enterococcus phage 47]|nr:hypothetical protein [Enterococcus phage 47]
MAKTLREKLINSKLEGALTDTKKKLVCEYIEKEFSRKAHFALLEKFFIYERNIFNNVSLDCCEVVRKQLEAYLISEGFEKDILKENGSTIYRLSMEF